MYIYAFWLRKTDTMTSQNIDISFWDTIYTRFGTADHALTHVAHVTSAA
jgi:hypothetical protein